MKAELGAKQAQVSEAEAAVEAAKQAAIHAEAKQGQQHAQQIRLEGEVQALRAQMAAGHLTLQQHQQLQLQESSALKQQAAAREEAYKAQMEEKEALLRMAREEMALEREKRAAAEAKVALHKAEAQQPRASSTLGKGDKVDRMAEELAELRIGKTRGSRAPESVKTAPSRPPPSTASSHVPHPPWGRVIK